MRNIFLVLVALLNVACADNKTEFYKPSFNCEKVKDGTIEYKICTDEKLAELDVELSLLYKDARIIDKEIKKSQRAWMKERNKCESNACLKKSYNDRVNKLKVKVDGYITDLLKAQEEAGNIYKRINDMYKAITLLEKADIKKITEAKPNALTAKQYSSLLREYATYYINTVDDIVHGKNLHYSQKLLLQAKTQTPNNLEIQLLLGKSYLELFVYSIRTTMIPSTFYQHDQAYDESYTKMAPLLKETYMEYVRLCKEQNIEPTLTEIEKLIVQRNRMFLEYDNTFTGEKTWWPRYPEPSKYKDRFDNMCGEYVEMLNKMPDDDLTQCSRYVNEENSMFEFVSSSEAPEEFKRFGEEDKDFKNMSTHLFKFKDTYFSDNYDSIYPVSEHKKRVHLCSYMYVDFSKEFQKCENGYFCRSFNNYRTIYKNQKD